MFWSDSIVFSVWFLPGMYEDTKTPPRYWIIDL